MKTYYVYILKVASDKNQYYIGYTNDLHRRLQQHANKSVKTTKRLGRPRLVYYEAYSEKDLAQERERQLKRFGSAYYGLLKRINQG